MKLTKQQELFCREYAKTGNQTQSAIKAGYSKNTATMQASRLLTKDNIKEYLKKLSEKAENKAIADIQEMQETLTSIIRQQLTEEELIPVRQGEYTEIVHEQKTPYIRDVISAVNMLAKMQGAFTEQYKIDLTPVVIRDDLKDDE